MSYRVFSVASDAVYFGVTIYTKNNMRSLFYATDDYFWGDLFDALKTSIKEEAADCGVRIIEIQVYLDGIYKGSVRAEGGRIQDNFSKLFSQEEMAPMLEEVRERIRKLLTKYKKRQSKNWFSRLMGTKHAKENPPI